MQSRRRVRDGARVSEGVRGVSGQPDWGAGRVWGAARLPPVYLQRVGWWSEHVLLL